MGKVRRGKQEAGKSEEILFVYLIVGVAVHHMPIQEIIKIRSIGTGSKNALSPATLPLLAPRESGATEDDKDNVDESCD